MPKLHRAVLRLATKDRPGLVADVSTLLFRLGANVSDANQHVDTELGSFFQRIEFVLPAESPEDRDRMEREIGASCEKWGMQWSLRFPDDALRRLAVLASKRPHAPLEILGRHRTGELPCEIAFVLSNHKDLELEVTRRGYRFIHEPIVGGDKAAQEARVQALLEAERVDLIVLARYMQILSPELVARWPDRIINIHHSFLPAFAGAEPYRQAHRRGVKLIGATSHYVTADLDPGPIIAQDVIRVSHRDSVEAMERKGSDVERRVLAQAVKAHLEDRIITVGNKTVVFE